MRDSFRSRQPETSQQVKHLFNLLDELRNRKKRKSRLHILLSSK